jgi:cell division protein FtsB
MAHKSEVIEVREVADGILSVRVRCCKQASTDSVLSLHQLHRSDDELDQDISKHQARVEKMHADRERAKAHIERLMKK